VASAIKPRRRCNGSRWRASPEGGVAVGGALRATVVQSIGANDMRVRAADEAVRLHRGENP
jgi:hypothetical protein